MLIKDVAKKIQDDLNSISTTLGHNVSFVVTDNIQNYETAIRDADENRFTPCVLKMVGAPFTFNSLEIEVINYSLTMYGFAKERHKVEEIINRYTESDNVKTSIGSSQLFLYKDFLDIQDFSNSTDGLNEKRFEAIVNFEMQILPYTYTGNSMVIKVDTVEIPFKTIRYRKDKSIVQNKTYSNFNDNLNLISETIELEMPITANTKITELFSRVLDSKYNMKYTFEWSVGGIVKTFSTTLRTGNLVAINNGAPLTFNATFELAYDRNTVLIDGVEYDILDKQFSGEKIPLSVLRDVNTQYNMKNLPLRYQNTLDLVIVMKPYSEITFTTTVYSNDTYSPNIDNVFNILREIGSSCQLTIQTELKEAVETNLNVYNSASVKYNAPIGDTIEDVNIDPLSVGTAIKITNQFVNSGFEPVELLTAPFDYDLAQGIDLPTVTASGKKLRRITSTTYTYVWTVSEILTPPFDYDLLDIMDLPAPKSKGLKARIRDFYWDYLGYVEDNLPFLANYGYISHNLALLPFTTDDTIKGIVTGYQLIPAESGDYVGTSLKINLTSIGDNSVNGCWYAMQNQESQYFNDLSMAHAYNAVFRVDDGLGYTYYKLSEVSGENNKAYTRAFDDRYFMSVQISATNTYEYFVSFYDVSYTYDYYLVVSYQMNGIAERIDQNTIRILSGDSAIDLVLGGTVLEVEGYNRLEGEIISAIPSAFDIVKLQQILDEIKLNDKNRVFAIKEKKYGKMYEYRMQIANGTYKDAENPDMYIKVTFIESDVS